MQAIRTAVFTSTMWPAKERGQKNQQLRSKGAIVTEVTKNPFDFLELYTLEEKREKFCFRFGNEAYKIKKSQKMSP